MEPDEVLLELVEPTAPATPQPVEPLMAGTSAKWVPDEPVAQQNDAPVFPAAPTTVPMESSQPSSRKQRASKAGSSADSGIANPIASAASVGSSQPAVVESSAVAAELPAFQIDTNAPSLAVAKNAGSGGRSRRSKKRRSPSMTMIIGICSAVVAGTIAGVVLLREPINTQPAGAKAAPTVNKEWQQQQELLVASNESAAALSPTDGKPITLDYIPFTPNLILHLRPAELWSRDNQMREFLATLGDLGIWLEKSISEITTFEAAEIEELTFAVVFGPRTSAPEVYTVFRTVQEQSPDVYRRFGGKLQKDLDEEVYEGTTFSYLMIDRRTFSVAPAGVSDALAAAKKYPALPPPELDPLLRESDRSRHLTLMFDLKTIDVHREFVLIDQMQTLADQFVVWIGKDISTVSFSLHLQPNFFLETLLRQTNESSPMRIQRSMQQRLSQLPEDLMSGTRIMRPQTQGVRDIIGRFPAMINALRLGTSFNTSGQYARLVTLLPAKAAPNLAAGALLTWNQSQITDMSQMSSSSAPQSSSIPDKVADRLKMPVLVDFRNTPLQETVAYIGEEIKTEFIIDGDALKGAGFTQNMAQTYDLGTVPALKAIDTILAKYAPERDPMVISVDESAKRITLTTKSKAEATGMPIYPTAP